MSEYRPKGNVARGLRHYLRNGRWGTCASCPRLGDGDVAPEVCEYTNRSDHLLGLNELAVLDNRARESFIRERARERAEMNEIGFK